VLLASLFGDKDNSDIKNIIRKSYDTHRRGVKEEGTFTRVSRNRRGVKEEGAFTRVSRIDIIVRVK